jgi:hypothetical protein
MGLRPIMSDNGFGGWEVRVASRPINSTGGLLPGHQCIPRELPLVRSNVFKDVADTDYWREIKTATEVRLDP